jgi:hypothetical protein
LSFEAADRFAVAFAFGFLSFEVGACGRVDARLCDRDAVQRAVQSAVAAPVESVALRATRARLEWCDTAVPGELSVVVEAYDRDLSDLVGELATHSEAFRTR